MFQKIKMKAFLYGKQNLAILHARKESLHIQRENVNMLIKSVHNINPDKDSFVPKNAIIFLPMNFFMCFGPLKRTVSLRRFF